MERHVLWLRSPIQALPLRLTSTRRLWLPVIVLSLYWHPERFMMGWWASCGVAAAVSIAAIWVLLGNTQNTVEIHESVLLLYVLSVDDWIMFDITKHNHQGHIVFITSHQKNCETLNEQMPNFNIQTCMEMAPKVDNPRKSKENNGGS